MATYVDNSVLKMIENSLYDGALYQYRDPEDGSGDIDEMVLHLNYFWTIVQLTFPDAWELPPTKSRLTHGAGIQAMGYVMDSLDRWSPDGGTRRRETRGHDRWPA